MVDPLASPKSFARLLEVLCHLAESAPEQEAWLRLDETWPSLDELVLSLDDLLGTPEALLAAGSIAESAVADIRRTSDHIDLMGGRPSVWEAEALRSDPAWEELRRHAARALESLNAVRV